MAVLEPTLAILDETDSGLDIDALRIVADGVNALRAPERAMIVVTHYQRLLNYIVPDFVHVLVDGRIVELGRQGAGARARGEGLRLAREGAAARRSPRGLVMAAVAEDTRTTAARALARRRVPRSARRTIPAGSPRLARRRHRRASRELGFPTTRDEDVAVHERRADREAPFELGGRRGVARSPPRDSRRSRVAAEGVQLVFVNGRYAPDALFFRTSGRRRRGAPACATSWTRDPESRRRISRSSRVTSSAFAPLNTALLRGRRVRLDPAAAPSSRSRSTSSSCREPACGPTVSHPRILVIVGGGQPGHGRRELRRDRGGRRTSPTP